MYVMETQLQKHTTTDQHQGRLSQVIGEDHGLPQTFETAFARHIRASCFRESDIDTATT
jgi:hypothetical protein